ncbi:sterol desaturase family protein [Pelomonas sp. SE-A7]|uniref:sterol desaturase family protein n=1 Tax=Pelomonas sp. SE-A7 TaxID=3054953 RepID=UPI00259CE054|nr:sterol desaturase family protein [Pelomonas sp. SE-A7]MDM4765283.1 sterol desaturase family protein [Pelomonas sp. SE-A7]
MTPIEKFLLFVAAPTVLGLSLLEGLVLSWHKGGYDWRACGVSFFDYALRIAVTIFLPITLAEPLLRWTIEHRLTDLHVNDVGSFLLLFLGLEFCYYWLHRMGHRVRWFWCNHAVHHSPNQLCLMASLRIGAFGKLIGGVIFLLPLIWLGFDTRLVLTALTLNLLYQFWIHATWIPKLGWLEYVLNTPSAHRVHHAANLEYLDANYGGVLIVFDRLFGTYVEEREDLPCRYGLIHPITTNNPFKVEFGQWIQLGRDLLKARSPQAVLGLLFKPPGWNPEGPGETTEEMRQRAADAGVTAQPS